MKYKNSLKLIYDRSFGLGNISPNWTYSVVGILVGESRREYRWKPLTEVSGVPAPREETADAAS